MSVGLHKEAIYIFIALIATDIANNEWQVLKRCNYIMMQFHGRKLSRKHALHGKLRNYLSNLGARCGLQTASTQRPGNQCGAKSKMRPRAHERYTMQAKSKCHFLFREREVPGETENIHLLSDISHRNLVVEKRPTPWLPAFEISFYSPFSPGGQRVLQPSRMT